MSAKGGFFDIHSHCTTRRPTKAAARCKLDSVMSHLGSRMRSTCDRTRLQQHRYRFCAGAERSTNGRPREHSAHRVLQVESFKRNMAACAVGADVFEIAVGDPVVSHGVAAAIVQHQKEDSLVQGLVFGRRTELGSGARRADPPSAVSSSPGSAVGGIVDISDCMSSCELRPSPRASESSPKPKPE